MRVSDFLRSGVSDKDEIFIDAGITVFSVQNGDLSDVCKDFFPLLAETDAESDIEDEPEDGFVLSM